MESFWTINAPKARSPLKEYGLLGPATLIAKNTWN
jgi:hypothetical protein